MTKLQNPVNYDSKVIGANMLTAMGHNRNDIERIESAGFLPLSINDLVCCKGTFTQCSFNWKDVIKSTVEILFEENTLHIEFVKKDHTTMRFEDCLDVPARRMLDEVASESTTVRNGLMSVEGYNYLGIVVSRYQGGNDDNEFINILSTWSENVDKNVGGLRKMVTEHFTAGADIPNAITTRYYNDKDRMSMSYTINPETGQMKLNRYVESVKNAKCDSHESIYSNNRERRDFIRFRDAYGRLSGKLINERLTQYDYGPNGADGTVSNFVIATSTREVIQHYTLERDVKGNPVCLFTHTCKHNIDGLTSSTPVTIFSLV